MAPTGYLSWTSSSLGWPAQVNWEDAARCRQSDPDLFFETGARSERRAKSICSRCEVRRECLAFALESRTEFGIWGGLSGRERRRLLRRSGKAVKVSSLVDATERAS
jgi:WhiB family transcriptional regulator, redox-sensing transcriptional regulator